MKLLTNPGQTDINHNMSSIAFDAKILGPSDMAPEVPMRALAASLMQASSTIPEDVHVKAKANGTVQSKYPRGQEVWTIQALSASAGARVGVATVSTFSNVCNRIKQAKP